MPLVALLIVAGGYFLYRSIVQADASQYAPLDTPATAGDNPPVIDKVINAIMGTLGERNNNPGNLRDSGDPWRGMTGTNKGFLTFDTPENGIRALARNLKNAQAKHGRNTIRQILTAYAPSSENNLPAYIASVSQYMGVSADAALDLSDQATLSSLTTAIINHENGGVRYDAAVIESGVSQA